MKEFQKKELSGKFPHITNRVNYLKHNENGVMSMCEKMQKIIDEERKEERKEVTKKVAKEVVENLINTTDWTDEKIASIVNTTIDFVTEVRSSHLQHA